MIMNNYWSFQNFCVGNCNIDAYNNAVWVSGKPGECNPLVFYGGQGYGKTHLSIATTLRIQNHFPSWKVFCESGESFCNYIELKGGRLKEVYFDMDVLCIDDYGVVKQNRNALRQFKELIVFFISRNKQVILNYDDSPEVLFPFDSSLVSICMSGILTKIKYPDFNTKLAILTKSVKNDFLNITVEVCEHIAAMEFANVRALQGFFSRVVAVSDLENRLVSLKLVDEVVENSGCVFGKRCD